MISDVSLRRESPLRRPVAVLVTLLALVVGGEVLLKLAFSGLRDGSGGVPWWLPQLGSVGETVVVYLLIMDVITFILVPTALLWLGYTYGRHRATIADR